MNGANVTNIDLGEQYQEDTNLFTHVQADGTQYLFGKKEDASDELQAIWNQKSDVMTMTGVIFIKIPLLNF